MSASPRRVFIWSSACFVRVPPCQVSCPTCQFDGFIMLLSCCVFVSLLQVYRQTMLAGVPAGTTQPFAFLQRTACQSLLQWPWADVPTAALHDFLERCVGLSQPLGASALCNVTLSVRSTPWTLNGIGTSFGSPSRTSFLAADLSSHRSVVGWVLDFQTEPEPEPEPGK